jgi:phosphoglycerol transferase MdoB-like AlkP superfamily enzyme
MGFSAYAKMIGIDDYYGLNEYGNTADFDGTWGVWDEPFLQFMCNKLTTFPQPFMSCVFTVSSHHPFNLPEKYKGKFPEGPRPIHRTIGYTDHALKEFFKSASQQPWFKNTLFVITADHCNSEPVNEVYLTSAGVYSVPIVLYRGDGSLNGLRHELIQQIDIMPTILGLMNYDKPYFAFGFDVFNDKDRFVVNYGNETCQIFQDDLMLQFRNGKVIALYNYKTDRLLRNNLKDVNKDKTLKLEKYAKAFLQQYCNRMIENRLQP